MKKEPRPGAENFKTIIKRGYLYIDKTDFIAETFKEGAALYTRPRRFGKTLNMSMLKYFYSIQEKPVNEEENLFKGLNISKYEKAREHQNRYPVISISLKDMGGLTYKDAISCFYDLAKYVIDRFPELSASDKLSDSDRKQLNQYINKTESHSMLQMFLLFLTRCLCKHYNEKVIILIDEYDTPLNNAFQHGYYDKMVEFFRSFLSSALKTNDFLEKEILTGCLPISQESIFTGLNNLNVYRVFSTSN